jgi:hypothetical protein
VIEQITYLLFIRRLDDLQTLAEQTARRTGKPIENAIFKPGQESRGVLLFALRTVGDHFSAANRRESGRTPSEVQAVKVPLSGIGSRDVTVADGFALAVRKRGRRARAPR